MGRLCNLLFSMPLALLPPWALFLILSSASVGDMFVVTGVGGHVTIATVGEEPLAWAMRKASRFGVFSSKPIAIEV